VLRVHGDVIGNDDGDFDWAALAGNWDFGAGLVLDPAPNGGHYSARFSGLFAPGNAPIARALRAIPRSILAPHRIPRRR
jgi:hypothetical protein